ncbi:MAG TPA: hybrid sensor histidine kinase/response regulator [Janthinobacterium sp.]|nr:hybrid sensor histidine kinase/response regulator [Janthinobacterium sp.]
MAPSGASGATILYVDDEALACKYFARVAADYAVLTASGVDAALEILARPGCAVDVLVTDYRMPGRNGGDLLRQVELDYPHIICILVTAHADKEVLLDAINGGRVFRILEKPLELALLRGALRQACAGARERAARRDSLLAIEETLAFLAHELNTPLATIANFARGIERRVNVEQPTAQQVEVGVAAGLMNGNARYCLSVLKTFVDSVKRAAPSGRALRPGSGAGQLIAALLDTYPLTAPQRAAIVTDIDCDFQVTASPNCVALVLSSILSNSLRALEGHAAPALRFEVRPGRIRLRDNGPGIPPGILARLLVDPVTMHAKAGGSGWGMIFCQSVMHSFGGNIVVDSDPSRGTTITLNFPERNEHDGYHPPGASHPLCRR